MSEIKMFQSIDFETISTCNRTCVSCIRNSHPDREIVKTFFERHYLPVDVIIEALNQCKAMEFRGDVILSHYNEPLMDERLPELVRIAKTYPFKSVFFNTNGDYLTEDLAKDLEDAGLDHIIVSLYMDDPIKSERREWIKTLFSKTLVSVTDGKHIPTHFSPIFDVRALAEKHKRNACSEAEIRVIINHRRQYLLCCDDVVGNYDLGTFPEIGIEDFWFGEKHTQIALDLRESGGRLKHPYCVTCPRA